MNKDTEITDLLNQTGDLIEQNRLEEAFATLNCFVQSNADSIDERFQAEMKLLLQLAEYKKERQQYVFQLALEMTYQYCRNYYSAAGKNISSDHQGSNLPDSDTVWCCWLQGIESAPAIVKCCVESIKKLEKKIVFLTEDNISSYVDFPEYIWEKYHSGKISMAHFSDLVRLELLTKRGGIWIDATTYISGTEEINKILDEEPLFMYRSGQVSDHIIFDNWFMKTAIPSDILQATKSMLMEYWKHEEEAKNYFLMHVFMKIACELYPEEYATLPIFSNEPCHILQYSLLRPFKKHRWEQMLRMSDVHKLTYKMDFDQSQGTFLEHLMNAD